MNQTVVALLRLVAVVIALGLTILLGMQGYVDWQGTDRSMLARIAIGLILAASAAFLGRTRRRAREAAP